MIKDNVPEALRASGTPLLSWTNGKKRSLARWFALGNNLQKEIDFKKHPVLHQLRELRNSLIGHPTDFKREKKYSFHLVLSDSITKDAFEYISYYPDSHNLAKGLNRIEIKTIIEQQDSYASEILNNVKIELEKEIKNHMEQFKDKKLADEIHSSISYHFSKLYENSNSYYPLIKLNFNTIEETYEKLKGGITKRYNSISALQGVEDTCKNIDYIIKSLKIKLIDRNEIDQMDTYIYIDAFRKEMFEFFDMIYEIDKEFASKGS